MSAEATSATGGFLLAQDIAKELVRLQSRINDLELELDQADALIHSLKQELARKA